jgi:DNA-binding NtrC family response regulator
MIKNKIFIVEDNRTEGLMMQLAFSGIENIEIAYFITGKDLLDNLCRNPDVVIVDMVLPDIHGLGIIREIRKQQPEAKVIVMSADERGGLIAQAQSEGIFNYIVKGESCLRYLKTVMEDLLLLINFKKEQAFLPA